MLLDNSLNADILHSLSLYCILSHFVIKGKENGDEEKKRFSYINAREISSGLKRIWESEIGSPSLVQIVEDIYQAL